jgi:hypothetical protein
MILTLKLMRNFNDTWRARKTIERATEEKLLAFKQTMERTAIRKRSRRKNPRPKRKPTQGA